ncbi:hypothetical protein [Variovorax sp. JS1663]|uniref:hypothetical protein n=1 Tax=Variovorax sp. JS1663 TaxID=1851577 RepID=UPI000B3474AC|nr:hypothetical protein [Variovorax sp. JS1663]OUM04489.1 hypothetical protein A8M77_02060 [Variovorax sp. JS1663]
MTWLAHCNFSVPLREGVTRADIEAAIRPLTDYFKITVAPGDASWKSTWVMMPSERELSIRFDGNVSEDFSRRVLEPTLSGLEPLAASPVAIAVFDLDHRVYSTLTPAVPRLSKTLGATAVLPQLQPVHELIDAALQAARQLPGGPIRARLLKAVSEFADLRTTQGWAVADVMEHAQNLDPAPTVTQAAARSILFRMDELTETTDFEAALFSRCVAEGLIAEDPSMPDEEEWEAVREAFGLDGSFRYSDEQVREYTQMHRAGPDDSARDGERQCAR